MTTTSLQESVSCQGRSVCGKPAKCHALFGGHHALQFILNVHLLHVAEMVTKWMY